MEDIQSFSNSFNLLDIVPLELNISYNHQDERLLSALQFYCLDYHSIDDVVLVLFSEDDFYCLNEKNSFQIINLEEEDEE